LLRFRFDADFACYLFSLPPFSLLITSRVSTAPPAFALMLMPACYADFSRLPDAMLFITTPLRACRLRFFIDDLRLPPRRRLSFFRCASAFRAPHIDARFAPLAMPVDSA